MFVGQPNSCDKLQQVINILNYMEVQHPDWPIEVFVIPLPSDPDTSRSMKRTIMSNLDILFKKHTPDVRVLN